MHPTTKKEPTETISFKHLYFLSQGREVFELALEMLVLGVNRMLRTKTLF